MPEIINKTPHPVFILDDNNTVVRSFPRSKGMIRLSEDTKLIGQLDGVPITATVWGETEDVPSYNPNVFYIVSQLVKNALPDRTDLLVPKGVVRDDSGNIIGCKYLDVGDSKVLI